MTLTFRPSNLHRRKVCPGSARMEAAVTIVEPDSEYAAEGSLLHRHFANKTLDRSVLSDEQRDILERADALQADVIRRVEEECACVAMQFVEATEDKLTFRDTRGGNVLFDGTPDYLRVYGGIGHARALIVIDAKFGYNEVAAAESNFQLAAYSVMGHDDTPAQDVYCAIIQPRVAKDLRVTVARYHASEIESVRGAVLQIMAACAEPDAPLLPSEDACRYCTARFECKAVAGAVTSLATLPQGKELKALVETMPADELGKLADCIKLARLETFGGVVMARVLELTKAGQMPGWTLKSNGKNREIQNVKALFLAFKERWEGHPKYADGKLTIADDFLACMKPKIGDLEALTGELESCGQTKAKRQFRELCDGNIEYTEKEQTAVREKL